MQTKARQQLAIHKGQALAVCWLLQQPVGSGGAHADAGLQPATERDRMVRSATHESGPGDAGLSPAGAAALPQGPRNPLPGRGEGVARRTRAEGRPVRDAKAQDQGLLQLLEVRGDRLRRCRHCGAWFWRERKREYCGPCFQSGTARSKVHRAKAAQGRRLVAGFPVAPGVAFEPKT
jgi:hypothetical protein